MQAMFETLAGWISAAWHALGAVLALHWPGLLMLVLLLLCLIALRWSLRRHHDWWHAAPARARSWSEGLRRQLAYLSTRREWRYASPWVLLLGDADARTGDVVRGLLQGTGQGQGSTALLHAGGMQLPGTEWQVLDAGVVIDIDPAYRGSSAEADEYWQRVLTDLRFQRPERPLDAVVLTLPAATLLSTVSGVLPQVSERLYRQLFELQKQHAFTLPVYVLVTGCEMVSGFEAYWRAQPAGRLGEIFGWSNPYALGHRFDPGWVDEAFQQIGGGLQRAQLRVAASARQHTEEALYLFPQRFQRLRASLRTALTSVFRSSALQEDYMVRGLYFCGSLQASEGSAFVSDLFNERIFAERHLARPTQQGILSRNRVLRRLQLGLIAVVVALAVGLALIGLRLRQQVDSALVVSQQVQAEMPVISEANLCSAGFGKTIYSELERLARVDFSFRFPLIPASWFDASIRHDAAQRLAGPYMEQAVFPGIACRMEQSARALLETGLQAPDPDLPPTDAVNAQIRQVTDYLDQLLALDQAQRSFTYLAQASSAGSSRSQEQRLRRFNALAEFAWGEPLPEQVMLPQRLPSLALAEQQITLVPKLPDRFREQATQRVIIMLAQTRVVLQGRVRQGRQLAADLADPQALVDVRQFAGWLHFADGDWLAASPPQDPCGRVVVEVGKRIDELVDNDGYPASLREGLSAFGSASDIRRGTSECRIQALQTIASTRFAPYGAVSDGSRLASWVAPELAGLDAIKPLAMSQFPGTVGFACQAPLSGWDAATLTEAQRYADDYSEFRKQQKLPTPSQVDAAQKPLYDRIGRRQLGQVLNQRIHQAEQVRGFSDRMGNWGPILASADEQLGGESRAFAQSQPILQTLLAAYADFGLDAQGVVACARDFANGQLEAANRLSEASALYQPKADPRAVGNSGETLRDFYALGTAAQTRQYLQQQLDRAQVLGNYTQPFVQMLKTSSPASVVATTPTQGEAYWSATINELGQFLEAKEPNGQVALLHGFIQDGLRGMAQDNCATQLDGAGTGSKDVSLDPGLFAERYTFLARQATDFCVAGSRALAFQDYQSLAQRFNSQLAGLFPFGPASRPDASLATVKQFFLDYAKQRETLRAELEGAVQSRRTRAVTSFLDQLDAVAELFDGSLSAGAVSQPLGVDLTFRYQPPGAVLVDPNGGDAADQLISWDFSSGQTQASYPNGSNHVSWQYGDRVSLTLRWARLSTFRPEADASQPDLRISGQEATFSAQGPWALLRLAAAHRDPGSQLSDPLNLNRVVTRFTVPLRRYPSPDGDRHLSGEFNLALDLVAANGGASLGIPTQFPTSAPNIW